VVCDGEAGAVASGFAPHMLRHTYVTLAMRGKVPLEVVSRLVTHSWIETTSSTYLHATVDDLRRRWRRRA